jgi:uncharacterized phage protein (TIGR02218 family)
LQEQPLPPARDRAERDAMERDAVKPASDALKALLATRAFAVGDLYTFTLVGGGVLRYTSYDTDIVYNGNTYACGGQGGPFFDRSGNKAKCRWKIGVEVDTLSFDVIPGAALVNGQPFLSAVRQGVFDGAELELGRAFFAPPGQGSHPPVAIQAATGIVVLFLGRVAEIDAGRSLATFNVNSHLELLNQNLPRNLYQPGCVNTLGDASCGVALASFAVAATAAAGSTASIINASVTNPLAGYFDQGKVTFTSGANAGLSRSVKQCVFGAPGTIALLAPFPNAPAPGDAFTLFPGCDKSLGVNGCPKFDNVPNFRGFPFVPVPETAA